MSESATNLSMGRTSKVSETSHDDGILLRYSGMDINTEQTTGIEEETTSYSWFQVFISHLININCFGSMLSFGIFQAYYTSLDFDASSVSWIGTAQIFLVYFIGAFSGRIMDAGFYRANLAAGLLLQLGGIFATSFANTYWQHFLAQGLCQGLGNGLLFCPAIALVSTYFPPQKKALAVALVACGGGTGGLIFPAIAASLLYRIGFSWTVRVMGFVMLIISVIVFPFSRPRYRRKTDGLHTQLFLQALREPPYVVFCWGMFLGFWGLYFAYYYIRPYARDVLSTSEQMSFNMLLIVNGLGIPGRIVPAILADKYFGPLGVEIPIIFGTGILLLTWIAVSSVVGFTIWVSIFGVFGGGSQALFLAAASTFARNEKAGVRIGMIFTFVSFACLTGPPLGGKLVELRGGNYLAAQVFGGVVMVAGSLLLFVARLIQRRALERMEEVMLGT